MHLPTKTKTETVSACSLLGSSRSPTPGGSAKAQGTRGGQNVEQEIISVEA